MYACVGINVLVSPFQFWNILEGGKVWHTVSQNLSVSNRLLELAVLNFGLGNIMFWLYMCVYFCQFLIMNMNFIIFFLVCFSFYGRSFHMFKVIINNMSVRYSTCIGVKREGTLYMLICNGLYYVKHASEGNFGSLCTAVQLLLWYTIFQVNE